jgi:DNA-directed RNA polymerase sigma subunit (sigma70/sigma32)
MTFHPLWIVNLLLEYEPALLGEATVRLPPRGHRWIAVYTGVEPGVQVARSTGLTDRKAALELAREWEAEARQRRLAIHRGSASRRGEPGGLTQDEVARILKLSPRAVRAIEKRAIRKLRRHPAIADLWRDHFGAKESR